MCKLEQILHRHEPQMKTEGQKAGEGREQTGFAREPPSRSGRTRQAGASTPTAIIMHFIRSPYTLSLFFDGDGDELWPRSQMTR